MSRQSSYIYMKTQIALKVRILFLTVCLVCTMHDPLCAQTNTITLNCTNTTIEDILNQIENQSEYNFLYNKAIVDVSTRISISLSNKNITQTLDQLFRDTDISYVILHKQIVLSKKSERQSQPQNMVTISGKVVYQNGEEVIGANVVQRGTGNGTVTDLNGSFTITVPLHAEMEVTFLSDPLRFKVIPEKRVYHIVMGEGTHFLDEVLIVGYGVQQKKLITGSTVQISGENIRKMNTTNVYNALQSQTPGVNITQQSGMPGDGFHVIIRGIGTNGNSSPLVVVDGVAGASLGMLNPSDIESIDILKDAASAAIYGSRAANGVILVTTRQAGSGKPGFTYDGFYGVQTLARKANLLNATQYMEIMNMIAVADGITPYDYSSLMPRQFAMIEQGEWNGTDWLEEATRKNAPIQSHAFNMTTGNETNRLAIGLSMLSMEGILGNPSPPKYDRYNFRINSEMVLLQKGERKIWKVGENFTYSHHRRNSNLNIGNQWSSDIRNILVASPLLPAYNDKGDLYIYKDMIADNWQVDMAMANPLAWIELVRRNNTNKGFDLQGNIYTDLNLSRGLTLRSSFGYKSSARSVRSYSPAYKIADKAENISDDVSQQMESGWSWTLDNTANYQITAGYHHFDLLAGQSLEKWGYGETLDGKNSYSIFPGSFEHAWLSNTQGISPEETSLNGQPFANGALSSFFGRINYDYDRKYLLTAVLRIDGSSNFARGHRWGKFPALSAGWIMSNEPFMESSQYWLDMFKLRAGWGENGNSAIDNFQYLATIAFDNDHGYYFNDDKRNLVTGAYPDIIANPNLTWETSEQINIGIDVVVARNRLRMSMDYYRKITKDWLVRAPTLTSFGTNAPMINGGDIRNTGFEMIANWNDRIRYFRYSALLNISGNRNKVTRIANSEGVLYGPENILSQNTGRLYQAKVGYPIGYFYGYKTNGIFQNQADIEAMQGAVLQAEPQPGDVRFVDRNGDGKIDPEDKDMIGDPHPDLLVGFGLDMEYRGFDFNITGSGAFGQQIAKSYRAYANMTQENYTIDVYDYWRGEGSTNSRPRLTSGRHTNWKEISDLLLEDGDYMKIRSITLGYDFTQLFREIPFERARIYFTVQNAFTFTGYSGMDPEVGYNAGDSWASGIDLGFYPSPRTFLIGCSLNF